MPGNAGDLAKNLERLQTFADPDIIRAMEIAETLIVGHAKANHERPPKDGRHPSARYYDRTGMLTNTIRQGEVEVFLGSIVGRVYAGGSAAGGSVAYAAPVEKGTQSHDGQMGHTAYPYLTPALEELHGQILNVLADGVRRSFR